MQLLCVHTNTNRFENVSGMLSPTAIQAYIYTGIQEHMNIAVDKPMTIISCPMDSSMFHFVQDSVSTLVLTNCHSIAKVC